MQIITKRLLGMMLFFFMLLTSGYAQDEVDDMQEENEVEEVDDSENPSDSRNEMQTLISPGSTGGYGAITIGYTQVNKLSAFTGGIRGGVVLGHTFTFGIAGYGFVTEQFKNPILHESNNYQIAGGYGGLFMEAIILPLKPVHLSIPVVLGAGGLSYFRSYDYSDPHNWEDYTYSDIAHDAFFVIEPGIEIDINMLKFMRISMGSSYRFTTDVSLTTYIENDAKLTEQTLAPANAMKGWSAYLSFKFGAF